MRITLILQVCTEPSEVLRTTNYLSSFAKHDLQGETFQNDPSLAHLAQKAHSVGRCRKIDLQQSEYEANHWKIIDKKTIFAL